MFFLKKLLEVFEKKGFRADMPAENGAPCVILPGQKVSRAVRAEAGRVVCGRVCAGADGAKNARGAEGKKAGYAWFEAVRTFLNRSGQVRSLGQADGNRTMFAGGTLSPRGASACGITRANDKNSGTFGRIADLRARVGSVGGTSPCGDARFLSQKRESRGQEGGFFPRVSDFGADFGKEGRFARDGVVSARGDMAFAREDMLSAGEDVLFTREKAARTPDFGCGFGDELSASDKEFFATLASLRGLNVAERRQNR